MCSVVPGCKRTYLSQRDLQAHVNHRHMRAAKSSAGRPEPQHFGPPPPPPPPINHPMQHPPQASGTPHMVYNQAPPPPMSSAPPPITPPPGHIMGQMPPYMNHPPPGPPPQHSGPPVNAPPPHHYNPNSMQQFPEDQGTLSPPFSQPGGLSPGMWPAPRGPPPPRMQGPPPQGQMPGPHHPDQGRYRPYYHFSWSPVKRSPEYAGLAESPILDPSVGKVLEKAAFRVVNRDRVVSLLFGLGVLVEDVQHGVVQRDEEHGRLDFVVEEAAVVQFLQDSGDVQKRDSGEVQDQAVEVHSGNHDVGGKLGAPVDPDRKVLEVGGQVQVLHVALILRLLDGSTRGVQEAFL
ncbi:hypothetical protein FQN60_006018 [Etheostoma spectabile]|uniref:RING-type E3 ubiquitin transferase n=1 Tax=Etheostoma spectabile TaxID=54343 RepID=A0A5J5CD89_9PERO|nr:hypothetical protein FQN60_006018 [Etheostoma spectabile]